MEWTWRKTKLNSESHNYPGEGRSSLLAMDVSTGVPESRSLLAPVPFEGFAFASLGPDEAETSAALDDATWDAYVCPPNDLMVMDATIPLYGDGTGETTASPDIVTW